MSPIHLFFRDHTGTILTFLVIIASYLVIVLPSTFTGWLTPFFCLHGATVVDGTTLYEKSIRDIFTVASLTILLLILRYFLCHTVFRLIARWLKIEDSLERPQVVHKCEVFLLKSVHCRSSAGQHCTIFFLFLQESRLFENILDLP